MQKNKGSTTFQKTQKNTQGIEGIDLITGTAYNECNCLSIQYYMDKKNRASPGIVFWATDYAQSTDKLWDHTW